jgi:phosphomannomutase/phosphoglucomutase
MDDAGKYKLQIGREQSARALPLLAALLVALAAWLLFTGGLRMRDATRASNLQQARDDAVIAMKRGLADEARKFSARLAAPDVAAALASGDAETAARALVVGWPDATRSAFWPVDLQAQYAALPRSGYGTLAVLEAAVAAGKPVARIVRSPAGEHLALAAPAPAAQPPMVAYAEVPLARIVNGLEAVSIPPGAYLALRQGGRSVQERGDLALNDSAEALAAKVPDSDLRIAAAMPDGIATPFELDAVPALGLGVLLLAIALVLWMVVRPRLAGAQAGEADVSPTLADLQATHPDFVPATATASPRPRAGSEQAMVAIDRGIFRAYDIRGVVGQTLDAGVAELIGQAIGSLMHEKGLDDIVVGRDGRLSGPMLTEGLITGLRKAGRNVIDLGLVPTPVVYFGCFHLRTGCGIAITGSHNPPDYNGFKIVVGAETLSGEAIVDLYARIAEDRLHEAPRPGTSSERDISDDYVERIAGDIQIGRKLKVVVDAGNGAAGVIGPRVLEAVGADVERLFCDIDGTFPNHHPDPGDPHNLEALVQMVERLDADFGLAFDGDGDRLGVVTRGGTVVFPDRLLMLFAEDVLQRNPGAVVLYDVKCTGHLAAHILRHGGSPLMWKTGHSLIKAKMAETGAELAGEMSGHFFFAERWYGFDDAIYAAARLLEIMDGSTQAPSELLESVVAGVSTPELKLRVPGDDVHGFVERFRAFAQFEGARATTIDGLRVDWPDGWGLVRASNTTPVAVMRFDADSNAAMVRIQRAFREQLLAFEPGLQLPF